MRRSLPSFFRLIAYLLVLTVMSSSVAIASYICPRNASALTPVAMLPMENCIGVDVEKPALCATLQLNAQLALENTSVQPALAPITVSTIAPVSPAHAALLFPNLEPAASFQLGSAPPYLRTQRLRI